MQTDRWPEVEQLFDQAVCMAADDRDAYLAKACGNDVELLAEVQSLLEADERSERFLERPAVDAVQVALDDDDEAHGALVGATIGRFRLVRRIAAGGMGVVYEAEQQDPKRRVAVKIVRPGLMSRTALRRFRHEAQTLAHLQHPGIAQVLEAGTFDHGAGATPYFAMEYVEGIRLDAYTHQSQSDLRTRLELLATICDAVHYAHQKGVIHRDLKPGNIIVGDAHPPKILDFGVARLTDSDVHATTMGTEVGQIIGTLPYMSPEQVAGDSSELDTRSDVYALGVIGYELLGGALPIDVSTTSIAEAARRIRDDEPKSLGSVHRPCGGDIEIIIGKALEKNRERRYQSAAEMAADIRRFLDGQPIAARPPSAMYQIRTFARRNKGLVIGVAVAVLVLILAVVVSTTFAISATRARKEETIAKEAAQKAQVLAEQRAEELNDVNDFLRYEMLEAAFPWRDGDQVTVVERIDSIAAQLEDRFVDQPLTYAGLAHSIGNIYQEIGRLDDSERFLRRAMELWEAAESGAETEDERNTIRQSRIYSTLWLARLLRRQDRLDEADALAQHALQLCDELTDDRDGHISLALFGVGTAKMMRGEFSAAESNLRDSLELRWREYGPHSGEVQTTAMALAAVLLAQDRTEEAVAFCKETLQRQGIGTTEGSIDSIAYLWAVGNPVSDPRETNWREMFWRQVLRRRELHHRQLENLTTSSLLHQLANVLRQQERYEEAAEAYGEARDLRIERLGPDHVFTGWSITWLGRMLMKQERYSDAIRELERAVSIYQHGYGPDHPTTIEAVKDLELAKSFVLP